MKESDIQTEIMIALGEHPLVGWVYVTTTGTFKGLKGGAKYKIGIPGMPDIMGQMRSGKTLGIEVKRPGEKPTKEQFEFIDMINRNNGVSGLATNVAEAVQIINETKED